MKKLLLPAIVSMALLAGCASQSTQTGAKNATTIPPTKIPTAIESTVSQSETTQVTQASSTDLSKTQQALVAAIEDEYKAFTLYTKVIAAFGETNPFTNIRQSEQTHIDLLKPLLTKYNVPIPANAWDAKVSAPATREEACLLGVQAEKDNAAMYDGFLGFVQEKDIRDAFIFLRDASTESHLPAFERCGTGGSGNGTGTGQGNGYRGGQ